MGHGAATCQTCLSTARKTDNFLKYYKHLGSQKKKKRQLKEKEH